MVVLVVFIVIDISYWQKMDINCIVVLLLCDQVFQYLLGVEVIVNLILVEDFKEDCKVVQGGVFVLKDIFVENWVKELNLFLVVGGMIKGKLVDLQLCFNINFIVFIDVQIVNK